MRRKVFSAPVCTLLFGVGYAVAVYGNFPLFRYYPLVKRFSLRDLADPSLGPAMSWYGWIATAALCAALGAAVIPRRIGDRLPAPAFWLVALVMLAAAWHHEREWFL